MKTYARSLAVLLIVALAGCGSDDPAEPTAAKKTDEPTSTATARDIMGLPNFAPLEPGTYYIDPDNNPSTPLRVLYTIAEEGWQQWFGAYKPVGHHGHAMVTINTVTNVVSHGCRDHSLADPPVGPTADDLATALANLAPFRVTSPPTDVMIYGYRGKHLKLTVPNIDLVECDGGDLKSWSAPINGGPYFGYEGAGYTEEFWILDVEGSRLVVSTQRTPDASAQDIAESRAILDSIRIEP